MERLVKTKCNARSTVDHSHTKVYFRLKILREILYRCSFPAPLFNDVNLYVLTRLDKLKKKEKNKAQ